MRLNFTVRFFNPSYHGAEWPPSPAKLFQALIAGGKTGAPMLTWNSEHENALVWLESLAAPDIFARPCKDGHSYTIYVPNNSLNPNAASTKTSKQVVPKLLDNHCPGEADLVYSWPFQDMDIARTHLKALDQLAGHLKALGWGIDSAAAMASLDHEPSSLDQLEHFAPGTGGSKVLRVPVRQLFAHLTQCYASFVARISKSGINPYTRPTAFGRSSYRNMKLRPPRRWIAFELQTPTGHPFAARWDQMSLMGAWLRHAAGKALRDEELDGSWIDSFVLGHTKQKDLGQRLSYVGLPSIGHRHSDGGIRRVMLIEPPNAEANSDALDLLRVKLAGWTLTAQNGADTAVLMPIGDEAKVLPFYKAEAKVWRSVTPMILHGYNSKRGRLSLAKTDRLLYQAFEDVGFNEAMIQNVAFQAAPYWSGCGSSVSMKVPQHLDGWPRFHVSIEFKQAVEGPILAGLGRHYGIGVFAAFA